MHGFGRQKSERETSDKWEPNAPAQSLIALGRRIGLHTAIAQLTARKQQLFEIYNAAPIERICDIYDIKYRETEACLAIVQQILEAKVSDTYQGPTANQPKKCPLPRIGSKEWGKR